MSAASSDERSTLNETCRGGSRAGAQGARRQPNRANRRYEGTRGAERPEYLGTGVRDISSGSNVPLVLTSTARDAGYQRLLTRRNIEATRSYSLHTTGFAFDIKRKYAIGRQARAFQFLLDRLTALDLIAWVREPGAIHVTVAGDAGRLLRTDG